MKLHNKSINKNIILVSTESKDSEKDNIMTKLRFCDIAYQFVSYPIILFLIVFSFVFVSNGLLPMVNMVGYEMFSFDTKALVCYYMIPYTALNVFLLWGYFVLMKKMVEAVNNITKRCFKWLFDRKENKK